MVNHHVDVKKHLEEINSNLEALKAAKEDYTDLRALEKNNLRI